MIKYNWIIIYALILSSDILTTLILSLIYIDLNLTGIIMCMKLFRNLHPRVVSCLLLYYFRFVITLVHEIYLVPIMMKDESQDSQTVTVLCQHWQENRYSGIGISNDKQVFEQFIVYLELISCKSITQVPRVETPRLLENLCNKRAKICKL